MGYNSAHVYARNHFFRGLGPSSAGPSCPAGDSAAGVYDHNVLLTVPYLWGKVRKVKLEKLYVKVMTVAYGLTFALGAIVYPNYRYHVRDQYFDAKAPWASNLFDIKEHWAGVGLALMLSYLVLSLVMDPKRDRSLVLIYVFLSVSLATIVWFALISGLVITSARGL